MARCSFARWRPIPENSTQPRITPTQAILHSAVDSPSLLTSLFGFFSRKDVTVESHFHVLVDGTIEQYMDTNVRADANRYANVRAVSIETEDNGDPDNSPWTPAQIGSILRLLRWLHETHGIPLVVCPAWDKPGVGWHSMWGAPSNWTPARGKTCPGRIRIRQIHSDILPALTAPKGFLMALSDKQQDEVYDFVKNLRDGVPAYGVPPLVNAYTDLFYSVGGVDLDDGKKVAIRNVLHGIPAKVADAVVAKIGTGGSSGGASVDQIRAAVVAAVNAELGFLKPGA